MNRTMAEHVRCKFWYISLPFSADSQREMHDQILPCLEDILKFNFKFVALYQFCAGFDFEKSGKCL